MKLWMVGGNHPQRGKKQLFSAGFLAAAVRFDRHEHSVDLCKRFGIVEFEYPAVASCAIEIKDSHVQRTLVGHAVSSPRLKNTGVAQVRLLGQVESVKNQRFSCRVEYATVGLLSLSASAHVINIRNVKFPGAHQLANVAIRSEE